MWGMYNGFAKNQHTRRPHAENRVSRCTVAKLSQRMQHRAEFIINPAHNDL